MRNAMMRAMAGFLLAVLAVTGNPSLVAEAHDALFREIETRRLELLVLRAKLLARSGTYLLDVYESPEGVSLDRFLEIRCIASCKHDKVFREVVDYHPVAAFVFHAWEEHFITTWAVGAVSYGTRIYHVTDEGVRLVLDQAGRGGPRFDVAPDGSPLVTITHFQTPISPRSYTTEEVWRWNGREYEPLGERCVDNCDNDNRVP
jgi:hypothetical protein